jgi:hypothetical protein
MSEIPGITHLCSSWDDPQEGRSGYQRMAEGLSYIQRVHDTVRKAALHFTSPDPTKIAMIVLAEMGVPAIAVHPLVVRSIAAHLKLLDVPVLPG